MNRSTQFLPLFALVVVISWSCDSGSITEKDIENVSGTPNLVTIQSPEKFPPLNIPFDNPTSKEGIALGRQLFYDPMLDNLGEKSCASCHIQENSFSSADNSLNDSGLEIMPHVNLGWDTKFLWHGEVEGTLEDIMLFEVSEFFKTDLAKLQNTEHYPQQFRNVFGSEKITYDLIAKALAQFERSLISADSKFDRYLRKEVELSEQEYRGFYLFYSEEGDCFHCHATVLFKDNLYHNNGLNDVFEGEDLGHFKVSKDSNDIGKFKTPTLRNIAQTAPYMHDGRFKTLKEVLDFYSDNVKYNPFIDPLMNHEGGINLTEEQKEDVIAFLHTLSDQSFMQAEAFSDPNKE